jgi:hypothetical protein
MAVNNNEVQLRAVYLTQTDKAVKVKLLDGECLWFPKSQLGDWTTPLDELKEGDSCDVFISEWMADQKSLDLDRVQATD